MSLHRSLDKEQLAAYTQGKMELRHLLALSDEYLQALRGRAQFFLDGEHYERALMMLEMLEELDRRDSLATLLAIDVLLKLGHSDAAQFKINRLLARDPNDGEALVAQAELHVAVGELMPATALLERILARDPGGVTLAGQRARSVAVRAHGLFEASR